MVQQIIRASIAHFPSATANFAEDVVFYDDGAIVIEQEKIIAIGEYADLKPCYSDAELIDRKGKLLLPGFIDTHLHFPQTEIIASFGEQLLTWLENYTFPTERKFADEAYADAIAQAFLQQCLKNGTTTGLIYSTVHKTSAEALFRRASERNMLIATGKVCMDRNCPDWLQDTPELAQKESAELIDKWHGKGRNYYALTPRFAPTSSPEQMARLGELAQQYPDIFIQTHLSENLDEINWVKSLYPQFDNYLAVYEHYNMVRERSVYGHCIHLSDEEWQTLADKNASIAFCPTSNLFLGSGLFNLKQAREHQVNLTLASDVGGGTSFNMLRTLGEAYKIGQVQGDVLPPLEGLYMLTQGAATCLKLDDKIGNLNVGTDADFVILEPQFDQLSRLRITENSDLADTIFALTMLADDRAVFETWAAGKPQYQNSEEQ